MTLIAQDFPRYEVAIRSFCILRSQTGFCWISFNILAHSPVFKCIIKNKDPVANDIENWLKKKFLLYKQKFM